MTRRLLRVLAEFLELLAASDRPVDVGAVGPDEAYSAREAKAIGPAVAKLAADGLIHPAGARPSVRRSRHGAVVWRWRTACPDACLLRAAEFRQEADQLADDDDGGNPRQKRLF